MNVTEDIFADIKKRMEGAMSVLKHTLSGLRTGRASTSLLDPVKAEIYGNLIPINQVATINAPESRLLTVQVWDKVMVKSVEKAIAGAGLGLNPMSEGQLIRIPIPDMTEERRKEIGKKAAEYAEQARIAARNVRRDGLYTLKKLEKEGTISEDQYKLYSIDIQKITDDFIRQVDGCLEQKIREITIK